MLDGKNILVTGGTGSFGQCFIRTVLANYRPARLIVFSRDELKQHVMSQELKNDCLRFFLGDVRDPDRLLRAFEGVDYVVHAAALKQVPALEYNPSEAVKTNIIGAENVIFAAISAGVKKVIALSTDKAANPINLYGATKLCSDKLFVAANHIRGKHNIGFSVIRYGNVIGSRGSVVPFFLDLLRSGQTVLPITDERMTRFSLTLNYAVNFVIKTLDRMHGGELFVPKLPSIRIKDLVEALAPKASIKIVGIRPGEKLHEVLIPYEISRSAVEFPEFYLIQPDKQFFPNLNFALTQLGESGVEVNDFFEYRSDTNPNFLSVEGIVSQLRDEYGTSNNWF